MSSSLDETTVLCRELSELAEGGRATEILSHLARRLEEAGRFAELFEVLKLQLRARLDLPLLAGGDETLAAELQEPYEEGLLAACRRVGLGLLEAGRIRDGWAYLRPVGNRQEALKVLQQTPVTDDNVDQFVEVLFYEGLDVDRGYRLVLDHYGTCNAITAFQQGLYGRSPEHRAAAAKQLVEHLYGELTTNFRHHVQRLGGEPVAERLADLLEAHPEAMADGAYHVDTTHLSTVVNLSREAFERETLRYAWELACYGERLDETYQYPSDPPFEATYRQHRLWLEAVLGMTVEPAVEVFRQRAEDCDAHYEGTAVIEVYLELLARIGRSELALEEMIRLIPAGMHTTGRAPSLLELAQRSGSFPRLMEVAQSRGELLAFTLALVGHCQGEQAVPRLTAETKTGVAPD